MDMVMVEARRTRCRVSAPGPLIQRRRRGPPRHPPLNASPWHLPRYRVRPGLQCATNVPRTHVSPREGRNLLRPMARRAKYPRRPRRVAPKSPFPHQARRTGGTRSRASATTTFDSAREVPAPPPARGVLQHKFKHSQGQHARGLSSTHASRSESFRREILLLCTGQNRDSPQSIVIKYCEPNRTQNSQSHHAICDF